MSKLKEYYFVVSCAEGRGKSTKYHKLFETESRVFSSSLGIYELELSLIKWRKELQLRYFPTHIALDNNYPAKIELRDGLRVRFSRESRGENG